MSQLLQQNRGNVAGIDATTPPSLVKGGIPYDGDQIAIDTVSPVDHHHQGLPFTANGRLAVDATTPPVAYYGSGSAPFTAGGRLAIGPRPADVFIGGVPFANGRLAGDAIVESDLITAWLSTSSNGSSGWLSRRTSGTGAVWVNKPIEERVLVLFDPHPTIPDAYYMLEYSPGGTLRICQRNDDGQSGPSTGWYYFVPYGSATPGKEVIWTIPDFGAAFQQTDDESGFVVRAETFAPDDWIRWNSATAGDPITFNVTLNTGNFRDWTLEAQGDFVGYDNPINVGRFEPRLLFGELVRRWRVQVSINEVDLFFEADARPQGAGGMVATVPAWGIYTTVPWVPSQNRYAAIDPTWAAQVIASAGDLVQVQFDTVDGVILVGTNAGALRGYRDINDPTSPPDFGEQYNFDWPGDELTRFTFNQGSGVNIIASLNRTQYQGASSLNITFPEYSDTPVAFVWDGTNNDYRVTDVPLANFIFGKEGQNVGFNVIALRKYLACPGPFPAGVFGANTVVAEMVNNITITQRLRFGDIGSDIRTMLSCWDGPTNRRKCNYLIDTSGDIVFTLSPDGVATTSANGGPVPFGVGELVWLRTTWDAVTGDVHFDWSSDNVFTPEEVSWTRFSSDLGVLQFQPIVTDLPVSIANFAAGAAIPFLGDMFYTRIEGDGNTITMDALDAVNPSWTGGGDTWTLYPNTTIEEETN